MRILVTGGFGYLGANLSEYLSQKGHHVVLGSQRKLKAPDWLPQAEVVRTLWTDEIALRKICQGVDVVVHAAGMNAQDCSNDPVAALEFNGLSTVRLLQSAIHADIRRFIYLSTAHVYRNPLEGIIDENSPPQNTHPYATSHLAAEYALAHEISKGRIEGVSLRISNGFGAPKDPKNNCWMLLVNDLCRQAVTQGKIQLRSSGEQQRDFIPLSLILLQILEFISSSPEELPGIINLGSGESMSVKEMASLVQQRCRRVLNQLPPIEIGTRKETENYLQYRSIYRNQIGIDKTIFSQTIDETLIFCKNMLNK